jgi:cell division protein FtsW (lipid II flippase)
VIGRTINGSHLIHVGPVAATWRVRQDRPAIFFAPPRREARLLPARTRSACSGLRACTSHRWSRAGHLALVLIRQKDLGRRSSSSRCSSHALIPPSARYQCSRRAASAYVSFRTFGHVETRVDAWLDPWKDAQTGGYQVIQASFALAGGGLTGAGPGLGRPDLIPAVATDMIFAAIGEELGLLGSTAVLVSFLLFVGAGYRVATRAQQPFEKLLAAGLTTLIGFQAFIIIGGVIRVVPLTGITLPFVSYGGSSLLANYVLLALLVRISDETGRQEAADAQAVATVDAATEMTTVIRP